jgi:hypothetical protein
VETKVSVNSDDIRCMRTSHPDYQKLEKFVLDRLGPSNHPTVIRLEEHLLACSTCVKTAEHAFEFAMAMREALYPEKAAAAGYGAVADGEPGNSC